MQNLYNRSIFPTFAKNGFITSMYTLLNNISSIHPNDSVRKFLYENIKQSFGETDAQFDELCNCLCAESIDVDGSNEKFQNLLDTLPLIYENLAEYTQQLMDVNNVDYETDIRFIKEKITNYQVLINQLKAGIEEKRNHSLRFTADYVEKNQIIHILDKFLSLAKEIIAVLQTLSEAYQKLYDVLHPKSIVREQVLKLFKKLIEYVNTESAEGKYSFLDYFSISDELQVIGLKEPETFPSGKHWLAGIDGMPVPGVDNASSKPRGRPPCNFCQMEYTEQLKEILKTCPVKLNGKMNRMACRQLLDWLVALFFSWAKFLHKDFYGHISAFYRFFEQVFEKMPFGLRYLQMKIKEFERYLCDKRKGGFHDYFDKQPTRLWVRRLKRFAPMEKFMDLITAKFLQLPLVLV